VIKGPLIAYVSDVVKLERSIEVQTGKLKFIRPEVNNGIETDVASERLSISPAEYTVVNAGNENDVTKGNVIDACPVVGFPSTANTGAENDVHAFSVNDNPAEHVTNEGNDTVVNKGRFNVIAVPPAEVALTKLGNEREVSDVNNDDVKFNMYAFTRLGKLNEVNVIAEGANVPVIFVNEGSDKDVKRGEFVLKLCIWTTFGSDKLVNAARFGLLVLTVKYVAFARESVVNDGANVELRSTYNAFEAVILVRFINAGKLVAVITGLKSNICIFPKLIDVTKGSLNIILLNASRGSDIVPLDVNNSL
jgi:hypothetical protein